MIVIILGFFLYCFHDISFNFFGYLWLFVNLISTSVNILSSKMLLSNTGMNIISMSYYNNLLSLPPLLILVIFEHHEFTNFGRTLSNFTFDAHGVILLSCFIAFCLSLTGFLVIKQVSATSYIILNNLNKNVSIIIGVIWFNQYISNLGASGVVLSLVGGWLYSFARLRHSRDNQIKKSN